MLITVAICDGDKKMREYVMHMIKNQCAYLRVDLYDSGNTLLDANIKYDIYILDIQIPGINGIKTAELIREQEEANSRIESIIIFIAEFQEYMASAFDVRAYHYLVKPIDENKFRAVFSRAINDCCKSKGEDVNHILIKNGKSYQALLYKDIYYIESRDKKVIINSKDCQLEYYGKLKLLENSLGKSFFRCHRCYIVNMEHIARYNTNTIWVKNGKNVYLAQKKYTAFVKAFKVFNEEGNSKSNHGNYFVTLNSTIN